MKYFDVYQTIARDEEPLKLWTFLDKDDFDPKHTDEIGSLLDTAAFWKNIRAAKLLIKHGANVNGTNVFAQTPLFSAVIREHKDKKLHFDMVKFLLDKGADPNVVNRYGSTCLMYATPYPDIVRLLLEHGADHTIVNATSWKALDWARRNRHLETISILEKL